MQKATEGQKNKMRELGISFDNTTTVDEAREAIVDALGNRGRDVPKTTIHSNPSLSGHLIARGELNVNLDR